MLPLTRQSTERMQPSISRVMRILAPDGPSALSLGIGSFMIGAFLPLALESVPSLVAWLFLIMGVFLVSATVAIRVRGRLQAECVVVVAPTSRWPRASARATQATNFAQRRFDRHWVVPRQLPDDPRTWPQAISELRSWLQMTLATHRGRSTKDLAILILAPEPVAWELALDWVEESLTIWQEGASEAFAAIADSRSRLDPTASSLDTWSDPLSIETFYSVSKEAVKSGSGRSAAIVLDIGRRRGEYEKAIDDALVNNARALRIRRTNPFATIPRTQESFTRLAYQCSTACETFLTSQANIPDHIDLYLNAPVSITFALSVTLARSTVFRHRIWSQDDNSFVTM
jgi:hypothetical protein